jgi:EpsI family protein
MLLGAGAVFSLLVEAQRPVSLARPLSDAVPAVIAGYPARDVRMSRAEERVAGVSTYLVRNYESLQAPDSDWFSVYVGYYERQTRGKTIHSPKNCLPGAGWEAVASTTATIETVGGPVTVNRYLLQNKGQQALVLYWYQGRGRVEANEYAVKWDLLRDAAFRQRTEEALVRIVVPIREGADAFGLARAAAEVLIPALFTALPGA